MNVLVATRQTQGGRRNDFCFVPEDELVVFGSECDREPIDGDCGCRRSMSGIVSCKATTTMKVADLKMGVDEYAATIHASRWAKGWRMSRADCRVLAEELMLTARPFRTGAVVERRGELLVERRDGR